MITEKIQSNGINIPHHFSQNSKMELRKKQAPAEVLDNTANGVGDENHNEIQVEEYNNCTHGDLADYTCVECLYNRWRSQANIKKPAPAPPIEVVIADDDKLDRLQRITIEKVTEKVSTEKSSKGITIEKVTEKGPKESKDIKEEKVKKEEKNGVKKEVKEEVVDPVEIMNSVNWLEVFKYVGISIPVIDIE